MSSSSRGTILRGIDHAETFRFTAIFSSFRLATQPGKLIMALALIIAMLVVGLLVDGLVGAGRVLPGEFRQLTERPDAAAFAAWRQQRRAGLADDLAAFLTLQVGIDREQARQVAGADDRWERASRTLDREFIDRRVEAAQRHDPNSDALAQALVDIRQREAAARAAYDRLKPRGVFGEALRLKVDAFGNLVNAAAHVLMLDQPLRAMGFDQLNPKAPLRGESVIGAMRTLVYELPRWLWVAHPWFLALWLIVFVALWSLLGGAISRQAVVEAATGDRVSMGRAVQFATRRWASFAAAPLLPLVLVAALGLILAAGGLLFNLPVGDVVAAVLAVVAIPVGLLMAFMLIGWVGGVHLMFPALAAEGTDAFDALSRSYSYVLARPWRFIFYTLLALAYGVITYLFVGLFIFLGLYLVQGAAATWADPVHDIFPEPRLGALGESMDAAGLSTTGKIAAAIVHVWVMLTVGLVAAYAVSYYFSVYSNIYLILRRYCDGTDMSELYLDVAAVEPAAGVDKLEPIATPKSPPTTSTPPAEPGSDLDRQADDQ